MKDSRINLNELEKKWINYSKKPLKDTKKYKKNCRK